MSDGTLRALGVLLAIHQQGARGEGSPAPSLIGLEEPETALHPAAASVLLAALREASHSTQIVVTSHSPDLLDDDSIQAESLLSVVSEGGETHIAPLDAASQEMMRTKLFSAGELLRLNQLEPDRASIDARLKPQHSLFGDTL